MVQTYYRKKSKALLLILIISVFSFACGSEETTSLNVSSSVPIIHELEPATVHLGSILKIRGIGFSINPTENWAIWSNQVIISSQYQSIAQTALGSSEEVEILIPSTATLGTFLLGLKVNDQFSNTIEIQIVP